MENLTMMLTFSAFFYHKYTFGAILVQKISLSWNFVARLIRICIIEWWCSCFRPFLKKFGPNNKNCQFKLKFATKIKSNMQNSVVLFTFSVFDRKYFFRANLVQKTKFHLKLLFVARLIWICMQNSVLMFTFSVFDQKYPFWANLTHKKTKLSV